MSLSLCVYCGSRNGNDPAHVAAAHEVGRQIGLRGWQLVYGGGSTGLMGVVAEATRLADSVMLFQALGGGWWNRDDLRRSVRDEDLRVK